MSDLESDKVLANGCLEGDIMSQRKLYARFAGKMMGICLRYASCEAEAEDLLQEGFIKVFGKLEMWTGKGPLGGWIRMIIINTALEHYRKNKNLRLTTDLDEVDKQSVPNDDAIELMAAAELLQKIQQLPDGYRMVFNLYAIEGYTHKEIGDMLNISLNTSKSQFSRARAILRKIILDEEKNLNGRVG